MNKSNHDEALDALANNDEDLVIEVMRGDGEKTLTEENADTVDKTEKVTKVLENLGNESAFSYAVKVYRKHFKGRFLRTLAVIVAVMLVAVVCFNIAVNQKFTVSFYQIRSDKVSDNIRVVELADLHNNEFGKNNSELINKIKLLHPDLIIFAGDMMNYKNSDYSVLFDLSDKLCKIAPIYACFGNNELDQYLFEDKSFKKKLESHNVNLLSNEAKEVVVGRTKLQFIAVTEGLEQFDVSTNNAKKFVDKLEPTNDCRICLTHYPELFLEKLQNKDIDIAFTGHAHGGLVRIPKIGGIYSTGEGFFPKFTAGVYEIEDGTQVVVSRGLGSSSIWPRINNQPELVVVDICWH